MTKAGESGQISNSTRYEGDTVYYPIILPVDLSLKAKVEICCFNCDINTNSYKLLNLGQHAPT